jgi:hypothetical protein
MTDELTVWQQLAEPFPPDKVKTRPGAKARDGKTAMVLHYIDARDVMDRLDAVMQPENWTDHYEAMAGGAMQCSLSLRLDAGTAWLTKTDVGYPNSDSDPEPLKGAFSDALKRSAVKWGLGRFLYDLPQEWAPINQYGRFEDGQTPAVRPTRPQTRPAPAQAVSTGGAPEEPPPIGDEGYGDTAVFTPVGPQTTPANADDPDLTGQNRWGDDTWGCSCPAHGEGDVKVQKRDGSPYLSRDGNTIGHCFVVVDEGADKPWDKMCWGDLPIPPTT